GLVDWFTWGAPFQSFYMNFYVNIVKGKAAWFGVTPWYEYFASLGQVWLWSGIPLLLLAADSFRRWPLLPLTGAVILLEHSAIGPRQSRSSLPLLVIVAMPAGSALPRLFSEKRAWGIGAPAALLLASLAGARRYDWNDLAPRPERARRSEPLWFYRAGALE